MRKDDIMLPSFVLGFCLCRALEKSKDDAIEFLSQKVGHDLPKEDYQRFIDSTISAANEILHTAIGGD